MIGKHTEAANRAIDNLAGLSELDGGDTFEVAARLLVAFAHELDAAGDVDLLRQIRDAVRVNGGDVQSVLGARR